MTFDGWFEGKDCDGACYIFAEAAWNAGQAAELERLKPVIDALQSCSDAMDYMSEYDIPIGLPLRVSEALRLAKGEA